MKKILLGALPLECTLQCPIRIHSNFNTGTEHRIKKRNGIHDLIHQNVQLLGNKIFIFLKIEKSTPLLSYREFSKKINLFLQRILYLCFVQQKVTLSLTPFPTTGSQAIQY